MIGFHSVELLGHLVDRFGLSTSNSKIAAINNINPPSTLAALETFVGLTGYYRQFVKNYAGKCGALQALKTRLLKDAPKSGRQRKEFAKRTKITKLTDKEMASFTTLKDELGSQKTRGHIDPEVPLLIYVDASFEYGFGANIHQISKDVMTQNNITLDDVRLQRHDRRVERPCLYLSKELQVAEGTYWSTEVEVQCIVWTMQKLRHIIEGMEKVIIFTDHKAAEDIAKMIKLKTASPDKHNKKLIRSSQYISQFPNVEVRYRKGVENINADALSRLQSTPSIAESSQAKLTEPYKLKEAELDDINAEYLHVAFNNTIVQATSEIRTEIGKLYADDHFYDIPLQQLRKIRGNQDPTQEVEY